jgi:GxxExxY protein
MKREIMFSNEILDICYRVSKELGIGLTENIYENAICIDLQKLNYIYTQQQVIPINYDGYNVGNIRADICIPSEDFCLELKAIDNLHHKNTSQLVQQIKNLNYKHGVLFNFTQLKTDKNPLWYYVFEEDGVYYSTDSKTKGKTIINL